MAARHTLAIAPDVAAVINDSTHHMSPTASLKLPPRQLDRALYVAVKKIVEAAGGKWSTPAQAFVFKSVKDLETLLTAVGAGVIARTKVIQQAFYTPAPVAAQLAMVALGGVRPTGVVRALEPSCGEGALVAEIFKQCPGAVVDAYDNDENAVRTCAKNHPRTNVVRADFLSVAPAAIYDVIAMNPPYQNGQAKAHVEHALKFLCDKPHARLAAILPANFDFTGVAPSGYVVRTTGVPAGAFKESGTNIATQIALCARA